MNKLGGVMTLVCVIIIAYTHAYMSELRQLEQSSRSIGISERVRIAGKDYEIIHGEIVGHTNILIRREIYELGIELYYAKSDPIFDLTGTNADDLEIDAENLRLMLGRLSAEQMSRKDSHLILFLFPTSYLGALAQTERLREEFILDPTPKKMGAYRKSLRHALHRGAHDAQRFSVAFAEATRGKNRTFYTLSGAISENYLRISSASLPDRFQAVAGKMASREACTAGKVPCEVRHSADTQFIQYDQYIDIPAAVDEVRELIADARGVNPDAQIVRLYESECMQSSQPPYHVALLDDNSRNAMRSYDDIFFLKTDREGSALAYLRNNLGMQYSPINPFNFYMCAESGKDVSSAYLATYATSLSEMDKVLIQRNHGAALERVVREATEEMSNNIRLKGDGFPISLSASDIFPTHSAFFTFFQTYNPSFGPTIENIPTNIEMPEWIVRYSQMRDVREELVEDLHSFYKLKQPVSKH